MAVQKVIMAASAIIYIPAGHTVGWNLARQYWTYLQRRGYAFYAVARDMDRALHDLDAGDAQIVVMVNPGEAPCADSGMTTVIDLAARRDRVMANEPTVRLLPRGDDGGFAERFLRERSRRS